MPNGRRPNEDSSGLAAGDKTAARALQRGRVFARKKSAATLDFSLTTRRPNSIRLSRRHEWFAYAVCAAVFGTGAAWAWLHYFPLSPNEVGVASPAESWILKAHGAVAMITLLLLGTLLPMHVKFAWRAGRNLRTGLTLLSVFGFLVLTGYGLYYAGNERLRAWLSASHLWVGLALFPLFLLHIWRGKTTRPGRHRSAMD